MNDSFELDSIDKRIIGALQLQGRLSYEDLGSQVGLSASAALRRVRRLEDSGVLAGYVALIRARTVGLNLTAYIQVRLTKAAGNDKRSPLDLFAAAVQGWKEVIECAALTGEMDLLLKVAVADMDHFSRFIMDTLLKHPSVQDCKTSFVMKPIKTGVSLL
ncbi:MAG: Lrp/AsnC family transcriptional regulator [Comamonadaceae bacterium]|jgi:Lrp/AsnC family leucine-responsive transcriptional regulator|nr:Lrp/AsnC family transcriptional regulator [Comamonadaceae bacterium]